MSSLLRSFDIFCFIVAILVLTTGIGKKQLIKFLEKHPRIFGFCGGCSIIGAVYVLDIVLSRILGR